MMETEPWPDAKQRPGGHIAWQHALAECGLMERLASFDPRIAGTLPLGVSIATSDIDILCHAPEPNAVGAVLWRWAEPHRTLSIRRWTFGARPLIATFKVAGWPVEVFASPVPVDEQEGWRHFIAEQRLLGIGGAALRKRVVALRQSGSKTEPAFAQALGLSGDPYAALYALADATDTTLQAVVMAAGIAAPGLPNP